MINIKEYFQKPLEALIAESDKVCRQYYSEKVYLRGLLEFSNYCIMDCAYCGIRRSNSSVHRYRMEEGEIINIVMQGFEAGLMTFVLQSGEDPHYSISSLCKIIEKIKSATGNKAAVTLSCGLKKKQEFRQLKEAGCDRYLMRFETSDEKLYSGFKNGLKLRDRIKGLNHLKELGFETGSGFMVGLPGETEETRINNIELCRRLELDMAGIGPFIPHPQTPLKDAKQLPINLTIRSNAILRLALPEANIPATTAAGSLDPMGREKILSAGANVLMPNITPVAYKKDYLLYPGKICLDETGFQCIGCLNLRVKQIKKRIVMDRGDSVQWRSNEK